MGLHFPLSLSRRDDPSGSPVVYFSETHMIVVRYFTLPLYTTDRNRTDDRLIWTGPEPVPAIGETVMVRFNNIGECRIVCFASQGPYLGLLVYPLQPPSWWISQNGEPSPETAGLVFGREISLIDGQEV